MNATKVKVIPLNFWACYFLDSEDGNYTTVKPNLIFNCRSQGRYLMGSDPDSQHAGHVFSNIVYALILLVGTFGFLTNIMNVFVLRKSMKGSTSLKTLLILLAVFEVFSCACSMFFSTFITIIMENADRGEVTFHALKIGHILYSLARTGGIYITILITIERYMVVAFPIKSKTWLSPIRSQIYLSIVVIFSILLNLPWLFMSQVAKTNIALSPNTTLANFPYNLKGTDFAKDIYPIVRPVQLVFNYVAPFPLLLVFNMLLYRSIHNWSNSRKNLSGRQKREINAARMFSVVVLILLLCHTTSCVIVFYAQYKSVIYRELMLLQIFSVTLSAAINFLVYFGFGKAFREEFYSLMVKWTTFGRRQYYPDLAGITETSRDQSKDSALYAETNTKL